MSYLKSFPPAFRHTARTFRAIARFWYVDRTHPESCKCEGCFIGPMQGELRL